MERFKILIIAAGLLLTSCSTSNNVVKDDAYYSPFDNDAKAGKELAVSDNGTFSTAGISSNSQYDYQAYYSENTSQRPKAEPTYEKTETVTDTNGVVYTSTEIYYDDSYKNSSNYSYLEDTYDYYYDDDDDDDWNTSVYIGLGYPYGASFGFSYGYPYHYYPSYYYNSYLYQFLFH